MSELALMRTMSGLVPATEEDSEILSRLKSGDVIRADFKKMRNPKFHRKFFALLKVGFDAWEPAEKEFKGLPVQKNFNRFRKDCIIAAGYYDVVSNLKGEVRAEAKSMSFGNMEEDDFSKLYSAVADVLLQRVLTNYTRDDLDQVVENVLRFV
jgi:hypothetical protein